MEQLPHSYLGANSAFLTRLAVASVDPMIRSAVSPPRHSLMDGTHRAVIDDQLVPGVAFELAADLLKTDCMAAAAQC
jgi:hypothetical protein